MRVFQVDWTDGICFGPYISAEIDEMIARETDRNEMFVDMLDGKKPMTDAEIVRAVAENVMQWTHAPFPDLANSIHNGCYYWQDKNGQLGALASGEAAWNPLISDIDSCAVLDKMARTHDVELSTWMGRWVCGFTRIPNSQRNENIMKMRPVCGRDKRHAIVLAALKACGYVWEPRTGPLVNTIVPPVIPDEVRRDEC